MSERVIFIVIIIFCVITALLIISGIYFYNVGILRQKKAFLDNNPDLPKGTSGQGGVQSIEWLDKKDCRKIYITSQDGLKLCAHYLPAANETSTTVILIHGYTSQGRHMAAFAQYYHEVHGFNVLMIDCRGHGESEGNYIGFGWPDRKDLLQWIDYIIELKGINSQLILHGMSMGGGAVLMTSGENLPDNVKCIISDCAYSSAKDILTYQAKKMYKIPQFPIVHVTSIVCKIRAGYFFGEASALNQVRKCKKPILFIHGSNDKFVPTEMLYPLYNAAQVEKKMFIVENAGHGNAFWTDKEGYTNEVKQFISRYVV